MGDISSFLDKIYDYFLGRDVAFFVGGSIFWITVRYVFSDVFSFKMEGDMGFWWFLVIFILAHVTGVVIQEVFVGLAYVTKWEFLRIAPDPVWFHPALRSEEEDKKVDKVREEKADRAILRDIERMVFLKSLAYVIFAVSTLLVIMLLGAMIADCICCGFSACNLECVYSIRCFCVLGIFLSSSLLYILWFFVWKKAFVADDLLKVSESTGGGCWEEVERWSYKRLKNLGSSDWQMVKLGIMVAWLLIVLAGADLIVWDSGMRIVSVLPVMVAISANSAVVFRRFLMYEEYLRVSYVGRYVSERQVRDLIRRLLEEC